MSTILTDASAASAAPGVNDVTLTVNGTQIAGWQDVRITRGMERIPADFDIRLTERYPDQPTMIVLEGDPCVVSIGADKVITGYVDRVTETIGARDHTLSIAGRGKCEDLVDCSAQFASFQFTKMTTAAIAAALAAPFSINVKALSQGMLHPQVCMNVGEPPYGRIDQLCKMAQLLCYEDADGDLVIGPLSDTQAASGFRMGMNVEIASYVRDVSQRYSDYRVYPIGTGITQDIGQLPLAEFVVQDTRMQALRFRPVAFIAQNGDAGETVSKAHALWECNRRYGRGNKVTLTTSSWRDSAGALYMPNTQAPVWLSQLKIVDGTLLTIGEVTYRRGASGTGCDLTLMPPEAFLPEPILYQPGPLDAMRALQP
jgi:prophage tail gpP-like protein